MGIALTTGRKKRALPVPGTTGLVSGSAAEAQWYQQQLAQIALNLGRKKRALPVPGTTGLVSGSTAEAQWYQQQLAQIALTTGRKKRALPVPGTIPGLVPGSVGEPVVPTEPCSNCSDCRKKEEVSSSSRNHPRTCSWLCWRSSMVPSPIGTYCSKWKKVKTIHMYFLQNSLIYE